MDVIPADNDATHFHGSIEHKSVDLTEIELGSKVVSLICITLLAIVLGIKTIPEEVKKMNYGRALVIALYLCSLAFTFLAICISSTSTNNMVSCTLAVMICDLFYSGSKVVIYAWLIERVRLVGGKLSPRFKSTRYKLHLLLLSPFGIILILAIYYRYVVIEPNGMCFIGAQPEAAVYYPLIIYDFTLNCYLTFLFVRPIIKAKHDSNNTWVHSKLYRVARKTLIASLMCLFISTGNLLSIALSGGRQSSMLCLMLCTLDVTLNSVTVHWVTTSAVGSIKLVENAKRKINRTMMTSPEFAKDPHTSLAYTINPIKSPMTAINPISSQDVKDLSAAGEKF